MSEQQKTHYRKVFKSDHLGVADLEDFMETGSDLIFAISHVKQEYDVAVAGRKGNFNIAYFKQKIKPLVLNATNSKTLKCLAGGSAFVEDWKDITVQLYIDQGAKLKGEIVGGVRISPNVVKAARTVLTPSNSQQWTNAINAYKRDGNLGKVLARVDISEENQQLIVNQASES
jgi:hypothetical protein